MREDRLDIKALASSSEGNAYLINDGKTNLLLECGIPFNELKVKTDFFTPKIDGCIISHSHKDHMKEPTKLMNIGITCYMSNASIADLLSTNRKEDIMYRTVAVEHNKKFSIGTFDILPLEMKHDVYCLGYYMYSNVTKESVFFATDTYYIPYKLPSMDYIMVEANYDLDVLNQRIIEGHIDPAMKSRLVKSHMEIGNTIAWLSNQDLTKTRKIFLLHLSSGSSRGEEFRRRVIEATGVSVTIAGG